MKGLQYGESRWKTSPVTVWAMSDDNELQPCQSPNGNPGRARGELEELLLVFCRHVMYQLPERLNDGRLAGVTSLVLCVLHQLHEVVVLGEETSKYLLCQVLDKVYLGIHCHYIINVII